MEIGLLIPQILLSSPTKLCCTSHISGSWRIDNLGFETWLND
jgi:hypothetical protein